MVPSSMLARTSLSQGEETGSSPVGTTNMKNYSLSQRKVERPPYTQLIDEVDELGYTGTGRKYGVSDNSIRKWIKYYEKCK